MSVTIKEISPNRIEVNKKLVYRNVEGQWVCPSQDLTPAEEKVLYEYLRSLELRMDNRMN